MVQLQSQIMKQSKTGNDDFYRKLKESYENVVILEAQAKIAQPEIVRIFRKAKKLFRCLSHEPIVTDFDRGFGDGRVVCRHCGEFIRWYDTG